MQTKKIVFIIFLALMFFLYIANFHAERLKMWDEAVYANLAFQLSKNPFDYNFLGSWGDKNPTELWDKAGYRAPLLPYSLSIIYRIFGQSELAVSVFIATISVIGIFFLYRTCKKLFGETVGIFSALLFGLAPVFSDVSGRIFTEPLAVTMTIISLYFFVDGFMEGKNKSKILFGVFAALTALARYPFGFIIFLPIIYSLLNKELKKLLKDKYAFYSALAYLLVLFPWLAYSQIAYGSIFGFLVHAGRIADVWSLPIDYVFWDTIKQAGMIIFLGMSGVFIFRKKLFSDRKISAIFSLLLLALIFAFIPAHKEARYLLPVFVPLAVFSASLLEKVNSKVFIVAVLIVLIALNIFQINSKLEMQSSDRANCLREIYGFLKTTGNDSLIFSDQSPLVFYYTGKRTHFLVEPAQLESFKQDAKEFYIINDLRFEPELRFENINVTVIKECPQTEQKIKLWQFNP